MLMHIYGIDFTSRPTRRKPVTCIACTLQDDVLYAGKLQEFTNFSAFENALRAPGPWIAGIDFPFGQSRAFIENIGWPLTWTVMIDHLLSMDRKAFRKTLDDYRATRQAGDKEHRRRTDSAAGSISPQKLYGTPVSLMFFEGAPRLRKSGVTIPGLQDGDPDRIVVEAYPGLLARKFIGRRSYKQDTKAKQTHGQYEARLDLLSALIDDGAYEHYDVRIEAPQTLADDPGGDALDALLCAVQAAWAWTRREQQFGMPPGADLLEGWIADPALAP